MQNDEVIDHQPQEVDEVSSQEVLDNMQEVAEQAEAEAPQEKKQVPLEALQKERKKRQELEMNLAYQMQQLQELQQQRSQEPEDDSYRYESATREDLSKTQQETMRMIEEKMWIKSNPEKYELINERLPNFLKQRPNLAKAIDSASNRYEEAYDLMMALTPRQRKELAQEPKKKMEAPNSPSSVPKKAALDAAVDLMSMSDSEFNDWRRSQKRR